MRKGFCSLHEKDSFYRLPARAKTGASQARVPHINCLVNAQVMPEIRTYGYSQLFTITHYETVNSVVGRSIMFSANQTVLSTSLACLIVCPSVRHSVGRSLYPSVRRSVCPSARQTTRVTYSLRIQQTLPLPYDPYVYLGFFFSGLHDTRKTKSNILLRPTMT